MAKKPKRITDDASEPRAPITTRNVVLLVCFGILAIVSIVTVAIPEIRDDGSDEEAEAAGHTEEAAAPAPSTATPPSTGPSTAPSTGPSTGPSTPPPTGP